MYLLEQQTISLNVQFILISFRRPRYPSPDLKRIVQNSGAMYPACIFGMPWTVANKVHPRIMRFQATIFDHHQQTPGRREPRTKETQLLPPTPKRRLEQLRIVYIRERWDYNLRVDYYLSPINNRTKTATNGQDLNSASHDKNTLNLTNSLK